MLAACEASGADLDAAADVTVLLEPATRGARRAPARRDGTPTSRSTAPAPATSGSPARPAARSSRSTAAHSPRRSRVRRALPPPLQPEPPPARPGREGRGRGAGLRDVDRAHPLRRIGRHGPSHVAGPRRSATSRSPGAGVLVAALDEQPLRRRAAARALEREAAAQLLAVQDEDGVPALERLRPRDAAALLVGAAVPDDRAAAPSAPSNRVGTCRRAARRGAWPPGRATAPSARPTSASRRPPPGAGRSGAPSPRAPGRRTRPRGRRGPRTARGPRPATRSTSTSTTCAHARPSRRNARSASTAARGPSACTSTVAVVAVAHPAEHAERPRPPDRRVAEADALHAPAHDRAHGLRCGRLAHGPQPTCAPGRSSPAAGGRCLR